jgi:predicted HicB family RNase H-like nuclease
MDIMLNDETINELVEQLKIYNMQREAKNVSDIYQTLEQLDNTLNDMAEKISETQKQLRELRRTAFKEEDYTVYQTANGAVGQARIYNTYQKSVVKDVLKKFKEKSAVILNETKIKGKEALYKVAEFGKFKNRLEVIQEHNKMSEAAVKETLEKIDNFGTSLRGANQQIANAFRIFAGREAVDYEKVEKKFSKTKMAMKPYELKNSILHKLSVVTQKAITELDNLEKSVEHDRHLKEEQMQERQQKQSETEQPVEKEPEPAKQEAQSEEVEQPVEKEPEPAKQEAQSEEVEQPVEKEPEPAKQEAQSEEVEQPVEKEPEPAKQEAQSEEVKQSVQQEPAQEKEQEDEYISEGDIVTLAAIESTNDVPPEENFYKKQWSAEAFGTWKDYYRIVVIDESDEIGLKPYSEQVYKTYEECEAAILANENLTLTDYDKLVYKVGDLRLQRLLERSEPEQAEQEKNIPEQQTMQDSVIFTRMANEELQDPMFTAADLEMA